MTELRTEIEWRRDGAPFTDLRYSRAHRWRFDGGVEVTASSSPHVVPVPLSLEAAVDPEEALVASLSSCHMLGFLALAARRGLVVERYRDAPRGVLGLDVRGRRAVTRVTLRPEVRFAGRGPTVEELDLLHRAAHEACIIASSVRTAVTCEPVPAAADGAPRRAAEEA